MTGEENLRELSTLLGFNLTDSQKAELSNISRTGVNCYIQNWRNQVINPIYGKFCSVAWDGFNCWPATLPNQTVEIQCSQVMANHPGFHSTSLGRSMNGTAYRICDEDGVWAGNGYSNYSICTRQMKENIMQQFGLHSTSFTHTLISYVLLSGSILSITFLFIAISVYVYLKSMYLDRLKILLQMMAALLLKSIMWIIIVAPSTFRHIFNLQGVSWICNLVISLHFYSMLVATFWMLVLGHFMNEKLRTEHGRSKIPIKKYAVFCWTAPFVIIGLWAFLMKMTCESACWRNYIKSKAFWIIAAPIVAALMGNLLYLGHICKAVVGRFHFNPNPSRLNQIRKAKRDIIVLWPLLGISNLLFLYNPGGSAEDYYMFFHALIQSVQGGIVALLCCFVSARVYKSLWKKLKRTFCAQQRPKREFVSHATKRVTRANVPAHPKFDRVIVSIVKIPD